METGFRVPGNAIEASSIGITQMRFDQQDKINLHQDFWDSTERLFRHISVAGYPVDQVKN